MKFVFWYFTLMVTSACVSQNAVTDMKQVSKNGMTVAWKVRQDHLVIRMEAPTTGWVAIGFNTRSDLAGTNLIMAAVAAGQTTLSDRYIVAAGDHRSVESLGGTPSTTLLSATETGGRTVVEFALPFRAADHYHIDLKEGLTVSLLMAFSQEDDFGHHSMMRTTIDITL
jgi:DOMON domain